LQQADQHAKDVAQAVAMADALKVLELKLDQAQASSSLLNPSTLSPPKLKHLSR